MNTIEKNVTRQIGERVRTLRHGKGYSLEGFAKSIDISKLTLLKIEKGEGNPTLSVVWKIANGLSVPVASLLMIEEDVEVVRKQQSIELASQDKSFVVEPLFQKKHYELYRGYLQPGAFYQSEAHAQGVSESITVMENQLVVHLEGEKYHLAQHDAIRFRGDQSHAYENPTSELTAIHFVISYEDW